jgi:hypothetical protein
MINYGDPSMWTAPHWHQDCGDVQAELDHLRQVAECVAEQLPRLSAGLSVPEEGVMFLVIGKHSERVLAEVYSIALTEGNRQRKYGIFLYPNAVAEEEQYSLSTQRVIDLLNSVAT